MPSDTPEPRIFQISLSKGGVPKLAVRTARVNNLGIEGDQHRDLKHHGGPDRALCMYSLEHIQALQAEGHPIFPGAAGENITISGLDWSQIAPGSRLRLGDQVTVEVTDFTVPCANIRESFVDERFIRIGQDQHPGWSRVYARILTEGQIATGDPVLFE